LPRIWDSLDEGSKEHFAAVCTALDACGVPYEHEHRLVRGLDYYTRTTFEFVSNDLGAQNALLGGGRYDGLSEAIGGPRAPGIGFAMGEDRLVMTLEAQNKRATQLAAAYIAPLGERMGPPALLLAKELRATGLQIELGDGSFRLKKSFETANKLAHTIVILGEDEVASGIVTLKQFASGEQFKIPRGQLGQKLASLLDPNSTSN
jgi:histidyl-tRNA synthetase